jgi:DNA-binding LacI/PurR family transcriptional regulator
VDGCFFSADVIAYAALSVLNEKKAGLAKMVLVNYCEQDDHLVPFSIKKPLAAMGKAAFQLLESIIRNKPLPESRILLKPQLII